MRRSLLMIPLLICATPIEAATWVHVSDSTTGTEALVDTDTIRGDAAIRSAWVKYVNARPVSGVAHALEMISFDCRGRLTGQSSVVEYNAGEEVTYSHTYSYPRWQPVIPDSTGERLWNFVCTYHPGG